VKNIKLPEILANEKNESPVKKSAKRRVHALAASPAKAEGVTPTSRSRRKSRPMPSALRHARDQAHAGRGVPAMGESPAIAPPGSIHDAEMAKLVDRAQRAIQDTRRIAEDQVFILGWIRTRPSWGVSRTSLLMDEEPDR
jgi:hypothetical protein